MTTTPAALPGDALFESHRHGAVLELRLNHPARLNALTLAMGRQLLGAVHASLADDTVRALMFSGAGTSFCAGKDRDDPPTDAFVTVLQELALVLLSTGKPVVVGVQGWVVGAGLELMLAADLVVAARSARFMLPEVRLGLLGTGGITALLPAAVGLPRAKALLMRGEPFGAEEAERWGLVAELAADDQVHATALGIATQLATHSTTHGGEALGRTKALLNRAALGDVVDALEQEVRAHQLP